MARGEQVARFAAALLAAVAGSTAEPGRNFRAELATAEPGWREAGAFALPASPSSFTCPACGAVSHHPDDAAEGYCGRCHAWTGEPA